MNKRIIELAEHAGFDAELMQQNHDKGTPSIAEKFAALIVEECIYIVEDAGGVDKYYYSEAIEKHFGDKQ